MELMIGYCRLCAELKDSIEILTTIHDVEQSMEQKLRACCQWTTENAAQRLPHSVCVICSDKLDKCWLFSQSVQLAQQKLIEIFENEMEIKPQLMEHAQTVHDSLEHPNNLPPLAIAFELQKCTSEHFQCNICYESFRSEQSLREHCKQLNENKCDVCSHGFCTAAKLRAHRQQGCDGLCAAVDSNFVECKVNWNSEYYSDSDNVHSAVENDFDADDQSQYIEKAQPTSQNFIKQKETNKNELKQTKKEYVKAKKLTKVIEQRSAQQNQCPECGKCFRWQYKLKRHRQTHTIAKFDCWQCQKRFRFKYLLSEHVKTHPPASVELNVGPVQCKECGESFKKRSALKKHYVAHTSQNHPFECDECGQRFRVQNNLKQHRLKHTEHRPFECWLCKKTYKQTVALKLHMKVHVISRINKIGPCICELCGKSFSYVRLLSEHLLTAHSVQRPHVCSVCGLGYKTKRLLIKHQITHTEFEHKCDQCDRAFRKKASLRMHMETHTGVIKRPFVCACGKGFRRNCDLVEHRRIHTGEKPYNCEHCDVNFRSMSNFYGHLRKKHGVSVSARNREEQKRLTAMS